MDNRNMDERVRAGAWGHFVGSQGFKNAFLALVATFVYHIQELAIYVTLHSQVLLAYGDTMNRRKAGMDTHLVGGASISIYICIYMKLLCALILGI